MLSCVLTYMRHIPKFDTCRDLANSCDTSRSSRHRDRVARKRGVAPDVPVADASRVIITEGPDGVGVDVLAERRPPLRVTRC